MTPWWPREQKRVILSGGRSPQSKNLYPQGTGLYKDEILRLRFASLRMTWGWTAAGPATTVCSARVLGFSGAGLRLVRPLPMGKGRPPSLTFG
jgi:hypothetical protein